ncbi:MAG: hypothetical protein MJ197_00935 [Bacteroidales bacterium]|nr:hypothetical protein [Bacteroidales bacterium]
MKQHIIVALLCLYSIFAYGQKNTLFIDGKTYQAITATFTTYVSYEDDRLFPDKDINITIGKNGNGGLLQLSVELKADEKLCDYFHKCGISGDITLELANGDSIICKNNKVNDFHDGVVSAIYTLSAANMDLLKKENIEIIRFYMQTFSSKGNYLAANFQHSNSETLDEFTKRKERITITKVHKLVRKLK